MTLLIKDMELLSKPRERLIKYGKEAVSNEELIAIILRCGTKSISSKELASIILKEYNGINNLKDCSIERLSSIKGIGKSKSIELIASIELGKRVYLDNESISEVFNNTKKVYEYFRNIFIGEKQEMFYCLYLDTKNKLIKRQMLFKGTLNSSTIHPREIYKEAFINSAASFICIHNHPSGDPTPSKIDIDTTINIKEISSIMGINFIDHIIFGKDSYYSFYENMNIK